MDGDNRQQEQDERLRLAREASDAAYAVECGIRRDMDNRFQYAQDMAPDGRPLYVGTMAYETWVRPDRRSTTEKERK